MSDRTLILLRHAKSCWKDPALTDMERPLNKRGRRDASAMAPRLKEYGATFDSIFASPARRCRETIARMLLALPAQDTQLTFDHRFYTFERKGLVQAIRELDNGIEEVLIVGHNPALHDTLCWLSGEALAEFSTCAAAQLHFNLPRWQKLQAGCGRMGWLLTPKG